MQINKSRKFVNRHGCILKILDAIAYNANIYLIERIQLYKQKASQSFQALSSCMDVHSSVCIQTEKLLIMFNMST